MSEEPEAAPAGEARRGLIQTFGDLVDAIGPREWGEGAIFDESELAPEFFDLRTGVAGEILQKCVNYGLPLAIVLSSSDAHGQRFKELVYEHRTHGVIRFVTSRPDAAVWLQQRAAPTQQSPVR